MVDVFFRTEKIALSHLVQGLLNPQFQPAQSRDLKSFAAR
jgi:hypothetical protein